MPDTHSSYSEPIECYYNECPNDAIWNVDCYADGFDVCDIHLVQGIRETWDDIIQGGSDVIAHEYVRVTPCSVAQLEMPNTFAELFPKGLDD